MAKPNIYNDKEGRPQVGMEVTADILRFVSTGSPDGRPAQEQGAGGSYGAAPQPQGNSQPYGDFGGNSYSGSTQSGMGQYNSAPQNEDQLPF